LLNCDDFITILANKGGFLTSQRTFVRDKNNSCENMLHNNGVKMVCFVLVRDSFIIDDKSILLVTYSNLPGENLEQMVLKTDKSNIFY
jgi:hypothetical protein